MRVGFIGLGAMGQPMARNLAAAGRLHAVWNRSPGRSSDLASAFGLFEASSPADLAARVDIVLLCVSADRDVLQIVADLLPSVGDSTIVVDLSTVSRETASQAAALVRARGGDFLDAPVTGGVEGARTASLVIMVGGGAGALVRVSPVLEVLSRRIVHMGEVGAGQAAKAVNQVMVAGINQAVTEALAFGEALGIDRDKLIDVLSGGAAGNWFLEKRGRSMTAGQFLPGFKLALHRKDLVICGQMAKELAFPLPLVEQTLADYDRLLAEGYGEEDISALYRLKKPRPGGPG